MLLVACAVLGASACGGSGSDDGSSASTTGPASTLPGGELMACTSPAGFRVSAPASWSADEDCRWFDSEPFEVPDEATDERIAAIHARVEPVAFADVAAPQPERDAERAVTAIDGARAVRLGYEAAGDGLHPAGTPVTTYAVDLSAGDDEPRTLVLDAVGLAGDDHDRDRVVLDRMARTVDLTMDDVPADEGVVARYAGGGRAFHVVAEAGDDEACLRIPPDGEPACAPVPAAAGASPVTLDEPGPVLAGVAGEDVFSVTAEGPDAATTFLAVPVEGQAVRAFAFPFGPGRVDRLALRDLLGEELGTVPVDGDGGNGTPDDGTDGTDGGVRPVGPPGTDPVASDGFPEAAGTTALLTDVRVGRHDGFDRIVLELRGTDVPSYRVSYIEPPLTQDGSGRPLDVAGEAFLELRLTPASGVDLSGTEPRRSYTGPTRIEPAGDGLVTEVVQAGDFEANLAWVVGLEAKVPFAVAVLDGPLRLVVDLVAP